jgi:hypothetical protein
MGMPRTPVIAAAVVFAVALLSLILPSTATYDPWAWIVWGREAYHGDLVTATGPSWKPLPVAITTLAAPLGIAPDAWIVVGRAGALGAPLIAFALARRYAGTVAGLVAALPLALEPWWFRHGWLVNSEGLLVACVLGAVLAEVHGRRGWALAAGLGAAMLRPEAWPFLLAWVALLAWRSGWRSRAGLAALLATIPVAWLVPEKIGSGDWWRAATRAQNPDPGAAALTDRPSLTILEDFLRMSPWPIWVGLGAAIVLLVLRRRAPASPEATPASPGSTPASPGVAPAAPAAVGPVAVIGRFLRAVGDPPAVRPPDPLSGGLLTTGLGLAWFLLVAVMTEAGYSGNERYLIPAVALVLVGAAIAVGVLWRRLPPVGTLAVGALLVGLTAGPAIAQVPDDASRVIAEARAMEDLPHAIEAAGGADALERCGAPFTNRFFVPQVAWQLDLHAEQVGFQPRGGPVVLFRPWRYYRWSREPETTTVQGLRTVVRTRWWQIEVSCRPGAELRR